MPTGIPCCFIWEFIGESAWHSGMKWQPLFVNKDNMCA